MPEKGYFLLELARAVDHAPDPLLHVILNGGSFIIRRVVADEQVFLDGLLALGVEQLLDYTVITLGCLSFDLITARSETGAAQEVGHQGDILFSHVLLLTGNVVFGSFSGGWATRNYRLHQYGATGMGESQARYAPYVTFITRKKYKLMWKQCQMGFGRFSA